MSPAAEAFAAANKESPVVSGAARHRGPARPENVIGIRYTLDDGRDFVLSCADVEASPVPRWKGIDA